MNFRVTRLHESADAAITAALHDANLTKLKADKVMEKLTALANEPEYAAQLRASVALLGEKGQ
jgi:hypothetical protein